MNKTLDSVWKKQQKTRKEAFLVFLFASKTKKRRNLSEPPEYGIKAECCVGQRLKGVLCKKVKKGLDKWEKVGYNHTRLAYANAYFSCARA